MPMHDHEQVIIAASLVEHRERVWSLINHIRQEMNYRPELAKSLEERLLVEIETTNRLLALADEKELYRDGT